MPDDSQLARIEERLESFQKYTSRQLEDHENDDARRFAEMADTVRAEFAAFEKLMRMGIDAALNANDTKTAVLQLKLEAQVAAAEAKLAVAEAVNRPYRIALGILGGAFLTALVALVISAILSTQAVKFTPQLPPAHSSKELKER